MADPIIPGSAPTTLYKVTQKFPNGSQVCKVFTADGMNTAMGDLLGGVGGGVNKTLEVSSLQLNIASVNLVDFFKTGGILFSPADIS